MGQEERVLAFSDEASRSQIEYETSIKLFVEGEVEVLQSFLGVTELRLFLAALQQAAATAREFI